MAVIDMHFRLLGIPRGCDESALRRAFRQKALALHPDRNPSGADEFKKVNEAYEALQQHFRCNGGRDIQPHVPPSGAGSGYQHARQTRGTAPKAPPCRFTEEELFGGTPGGFSHERRGYGAKCYARFGAGRGTGDGSTANQGASGPDCSPLGGNFPKAREDHQRVDERWRQAHGRRVPVSGYSYARGGAAPFTAKSQSSAPYQQQRQPKPPQPSSPSHQGASGSPMTNQRPARNATGSGERESSCSSGHAASGNGKNCTSLGNDAEPFDGAYAGGPREHRMSSEELYREWERLMREFESKSSGTSGVFRSPSDWEWGASGSSATSSSNDRNSEDMQDDGEEDYVVHKKKRERNAPGSRQGKTDPGCFTERQRLNETHMRSIVEEKIQLKKMIFTHRFTPDPADVALMSDSEVYVLCEVLHDVGQRMQKVLAGRLAKGLCSRCMKAPKMPDVTLFACGHTSVCAECARTCAVCPICAATGLR